MVEHACVGRSDVSRGDAQERLISRARFESLLRNMTLEVRVVLTEMLC